LGLGQALNLRLSEGAGMHQQTHSSVLGRLPSSPPNTTAAGAAAAFRIYQQSSKHNCSSSSSTLDLQRHRNNLSCKELASASGMHVLYLRKGIGHTRRKCDLGELFGGNGRDSFLWPYCGGSRLLFSNSLTWFTSYAHCCSGKRDRSDVWVFYSL
jgi:hypothetical protein